MIYERVMTKRKLHNIFKRARAKIAKKGSWVKHMWAADKNGKPVDALDKTACKFCVEGALTAAAPNVDDLWGGEFGPMHVLTDVLNDDNPAGMRTLTGWNDSRNRKHAQVLKLLDRAIEKTA